MRIPGRESWLILAGLLLAAPALAGERTWPAQGLSAVELLTTSADLELRGWDRPEVKLESEEAGQVDDESQAGVLKLRGNVDQVIYLPAGLKVGVQGVSGDVRVRDLGSRLRIQTVSGDVGVEGAAQGLEVITVSGDIEARRVRGEVRLKTVSGDQTVTDLSGDRLEASSVSGELRVRDAALRELRLKSHSGDVDFDGRLGADGQAHLSSFSGDVRVSLPRGAGFDLEAETSSGEIRVAGELTWSERTAERAVGRAGSGGTELRLSSRSGDLVVRVSD
jgi:DUF4097 and DUF4098 domain-containing protein YvlB